MIPKVTTTEKYVAGLAEFLDPAEHPPPLGTKILLLTPGGICAIGQWNDWFIAWHPMPTIPKHLKHKTCGAINVSRQ